MEHEERKNVFKMFSYLKYLLESKSSVPFEKSTTSNDAAKCPTGYNPYFDEYDRSEFEQLEENFGRLYLSQKEIERKKVRVYHSKIKYGNSIAQNRLTWDTELKGGQITISKSIFDELFGCPDKDGEVVNDGFIKKSLKNLVKDFNLFFTNNPNYYVHPVLEQWKSSIGDIQIESNRVVFTKGIYSFSIEYWYYSSLSLVTLFEGTIEVKNLDDSDSLNVDLLQEIHKVFRDNIVYIPFQHWFCELNEKEFQELEKETNRFRWSQR